MSSKILKEEYGMNTLDDY